MKEIGLWEHPPVKVNWDDTFGVVYKPFQFTSLVAQLLSLFGWSEDVNDFF